MMIMMRGIVHKYKRANIDTDVIIPGPYLKIHDHQELAKHAMEGLDPQFSAKVALTFTSHFYYPDLALRMRIS